MKYRMSFTTGGLFQRESMLLAELYTELGDWELVRAKVISENLIQARTESSMKRLSLEIVGRLSTLDNPELQLLVDGTDTEQKHLVWLSICRHYLFVGEFANECLRESHLMLKPSLDYSDFDTFFTRKADWHPELEKLKDSTRKKLRQVLFKILREAKLLDEDRRITPAVISSGLHAALQDPIRDLSFFPVMETQLGGVT